MENIRKIFLEKIQPYTDSFNNLSTRLINTNVIGDTLLALQKLNPSYTRTNTKQFLSHYIVYYFPNEVVGETEKGDVLVKKSKNLYNTHFNSDPFDFVNALNEYMLCFNEWQKIDKEKLAETYRDTYRLLSEIKVSSPIEIQEPIEKLENTLNKHTSQIFGKNAQKILENDNNEEEILRKDMLRIEKFIYDSLHDLYWQDITKQLEKNSFENLCTVIEDVKLCMLSLCQKNQKKRDEIEACLDVGFLKNVLKVGMAQKQVKCLLKYCLTFLREYGQPCHDSEIDELIKTTDLVYTPDVINTIQLLVNIIREIASRINVLVAVVDEFVSNLE